MDSLCTESLPALPCVARSLTCACCLEAPEQTYACADGARCSECAAVAIGAEIFGEWFGEDLEHTPLITAIANAVESGDEDDLREALASRTARDYLVYEVKAERRPKAALAISRTEWRAYRIERARKAVALLRAMPKAEPVATHNAACGDARCPHCKPTLAPATLGDDAPIEQVMALFDALKASLASSGRRAA